MRRAAHVIGGDLRELRGLLFSRLKKPESFLDRRVAESLRGDLLKDPSAGPRIAVVGPCQTFGIAYAAKLLDLDATVHRFPITAQSRTDIKTLSRALRPYDYVFLQSFGEGWVRGGNSDCVSAELTNVIRVPTLVFNAYHPDAIYIYDQAKGGVPVAGPTGPYHSAIALFAYRTGLPVEAALRLFHRDVFHALGYLDGWTAATAEFLQSAEAESLDLSGDLLRWTRRGCFMHCINHPMLHVLYDLTRRLFEKTRLATMPVDIDRYIVDDQGVFGPIYPVYPPIAESYGVNGSYIFKGAFLDFQGADGVFLDLRRFVEGSYRVYAQHGRDHLVDVRVQGWLDDADTSEFLRNFALAGSTRALLH